MAVGTVFDLRPKAQLYAQYSPQRLISSMISVARMASRISG
jgi:hypothetical protein